MVTKGLLTNRHCLFDREAFEPEIRLQQRRAEPPAKIEHRANLEPPKENVDVYSTQISNDDVEKGKDQEENTYDWSYFLLQ